MFELEWQQNKRSFWIALCVIAALQAIPAAASKAYLDSQIYSGTDRVGSATLSTFEGWMAGQPFMFFVLLLGCFAINWSIGSIVKERDRQTAEFLFSTPRSRTDVYLAKCAAHVVKVVIIAGVSTVIVLLIGKSLGVMNDVVAVSSVMVAGLLIILGFMGIGYALTSWLSSERGALSLGIGIVFLMFLLYMLSDLTALKWMGGLSLFKLFDVYAISQGDGIAWGSVIGALAVFLIGGCVGWGRLVQRDL
ncbi:ABC transporter permease subunit [Paenibacillus sp. NPDC057934]|uniref:ABC transporter permease subunit n=1 Tax=Paenibacillus sp. NPDC057934 TaxID=3346282 RepID=UPI0036D8E3D9